MKKLFVSIVIVVMMYVSFLMCAKSTKQDLQRAETNYTEEVSWVQK